MGHRNKLLKFAEIRAMDNVYENYSYENPQLTGKDGVPISMKGHWKSDAFGNDNPLILELACGRGEYSLALGESYPENNYLGVDVKGARIWRGAKNATEAGLDNVKFLRTRIEAIELFFEANEVDEIWITFPDPFHGKDNRKLTSHNFLNRYKKILKKGGIIHLKTDDDDLYEFSLESVKSYDGAELLYTNNDIYSKELDFKELIHKTYYEKRHLQIGRKIKYIRFTL
jgi:tRNA (guanine-N7-)-methyltransferase